MPKPQSNNYQSFNTKSLALKIDNKLAFQTEFGLIVDKKIPIIAVTTELTDKNGADLLEKALEGIITQNIQLIILGVGSPKYQNIISELASAFPNKIKIIESIPENQHKMLISADIGLIFSANFNDKQIHLEIENYLRNAVVTILHHDFGKYLPVHNYNATEEKGNAFTFPKNDSWMLFAALIRAIENYAFPYDWKNIQKNCLNSIIV